MKLALTADVHLTSLQKHPERYHALENIIGQMAAEDIHTLIIAGDLFDESSRNYAEFDAFCRRNGHSDIRFLVIPGNHDNHLNRELITAENVEIISSPHVKPFGPAGLNFLFLPYREGKNMGENIADFAADLPENRWVLIGHGDWADGLRETNPAEPGVYMPLSRLDIEAFRPAKVLLGHIHKPLDHERVSYMGSPCGLDIKETGRRRFLIMDTETGKIDSRNIRTDYIYYNESFVVIPVEDEQRLLKEQIARRISEWNLEPEEKSAVRVHVRVRGYTVDKNQLQKTVLEALSGFSFYKDWQPDLSQVAVSSDLNLAEIANRVSRWIDDLSWDGGAEAPDKSEVLLEALHVIYGDRPDQ